MAAFRPSLVITRDLQADYILDGATAHTLDALARYFDQQSEFLKLKAHGVRTAEQLAVDTRARRIEHQRKLLQLGRRIAESSTAAASDAGFGTDTIAVAKRLWRKHVARTETRARDLEIWKETLRQVPARQIAERHRLSERRIRQVAAAVETEISAAFATAAR